MPKSAPLPSGRGGNGVPEDQGHLQQRIDAALEAVRSCDGARLYSELGGVSRTYRVFVGNDREFHAMFARYSDTQALLELWDVRNRAGFDAFLDEVDRLLHNYLAAAASLRDHTRRLWRKYPPAKTALTVEYDRRVKEAFADSPLANFVQRLRNFSLHAQLPVAQGQFTWSPDDGERSTVVLNRAALLEWGGWNVGARSFIDAAEADIDLQEVVGAYTALVHDFNQWFGRAFVGGHLPAFDDLERRKAECAAILREAGLLPFPGGV